jgi:hypothetical protein
MANSKISALTSATTVAGTEVLPIVQSSATVKVSVANLTPGLGTITAAKGGTGQTSYAVGDLLYADTTTTLAKLADVATGNALISGGVSTAPSYGKIGLTTHVSGTLPVANGGTNASSASITAFNNITGYSASGATGTTTTNLVFSTSPSITTPTLVGDATLSTGNLVVSNGKGIDFSATPGTGTSELFNDYEEGTWTPSITFNVPGNLSVTYDSQLGNYTKIGNRVVLQGSVITNTFTHTTASSYLKINGLPFAASEVVSAGPVMFRGITKAGYTDFVVAAEPTVTSALIIYASASGTFTDPVAAADMPTGGTVNFRFTITYQV